MAGNEIYLGAMIDGLNIKLDAVMGKIDDQILAIEDQLQSLIDIGKNTSQTVTSINSKPSDSIKHRSFKTVISGVAVTNTGATAITVAGSIKNKFANGKVRITATNVIVQTFAWGGTGHKARLCARVGSTVYDITPDATVQNVDTVLSGTVDIPVALNDTIEICVKAISAAGGYSQGKVTLPIDSITISYDLLNIVTESAFIDL